MVEWHAHKDVCNSSESGAGFGSDPDVGPARPGPPRLSAPHRVRARREEHRRPRPACAGPAGLRRVGRARDAACCGKFMQQEPPAPRPTPPHCAGAGAGTTRMVRAGVSEARVRVRVCRRGKAAGGLGPDPGAGGRRQPQAGGFKSRRGPTRRRPVQPSRLGGPRDDILTAVGPRCSQSSSGCSESERSESGPAPPKERPTTMSKR